MLPILLLASALRAPLPAQEVRNLRAEHRAGQTFLTWDEGRAEGTRYRVYRSTSRLSSDDGLDEAELLGEVDERSSRNQGRSLATGEEHAWVIAPGGGELRASEGLFVHTAERAAERVYYAVTSVLDGREDRRIKSGANATGPLAERPEAPQPVLQEQDASGELWGHWVGDRDTPFQPALSPWPSSAFNFRFEPGSAPGPRGLVLRLHAAGQTYAQGWPHRFEVPRDVDILAPSDLAPFTGWSFWFGSQELLPRPPAPDTRVWNYTQQRLLWTLDWIAARLGREHDGERVSIVGGSMGAVGALWLASEAPQRFAAVLCRNGLYDLEADDYRNPGMFETLFGSFALELSTRAGLPILERTHASFMAGLAPGEDWPVIRTLNGRNDETVGWRSAVELFDGLARHHRPAVHYFDERTHNPQGYWVELERTLLVRTCRTRRDRPCLRFERCTLDDDPGDGARTDGDLVGALNAYLDHDLELARATAEGLEFTVFLRDSGALDDAPAASAWAALTPRRTAPFVLAPGEPVRYALIAAGLLVDEHVLFADEHGLVHTPRVPLERAPRLACLERWRPSGPLFLGASPIAGDWMQAVVRGQSGEPWSLYLALADAQGAPLLPPGSQVAVWHGTVGADGHAQLWLRLPASLPRGSWIWGRALVAGKLSPPVTVALQHWP